MRVALLIAFLSVSAMASAATPQPLRPEVEAFIADMVRKHEFEREALRRVFAKVQPRPAIIRAMTAPSTALPWHQFRDRFIDEARISGGVSFWAQHAITLERASRVHGVPPEIIVAIIGIETRYGRDTGSFRVIEALATLAFDYPRRAEYFLSELEQYLLLAREAGVDALNLKGSYAGAMGIPQFMPGSYRKYAVDFDGDGRRDLWNNAVDAIGSVANYLQSFGWQAGEIIVVPAETGDSALDTVRAAGIKPVITIGDLKQHGIVPQSPVSDEAVAALFSVETELGLRYWLGFQNFYVITRYNRSINYAMAVTELASELRARVRPNGSTVLE
ncbi:MAG: lytic murein transglycosylase B [Burkholderiales bacterium]|nr:lytic murein transglycosylase B [Burkholderiales bacterium]